MHLVRALPLLLALPVACDQVDLDSLLEDDSAVVDPDAGDEDELPEFEPDFCGRENTRLCLMFSAEPEPAPDGGGDLDAGNADADGMEASAADADDGGDADATDDPRDAGAADAAAADAGDTAAPSYAWCAARCWRTCGRDDEWTCYGNLTCSESPEGRPEQCFVPELDTGDDDTRDDDTGDDDAGDEG